MELFNSLERNRQLHFGRILLCLLILGLLSNGFVIDLAIASKKKPFTTSQASKRFHFELNCPEGSPAQNREKVFEYLSRDIVQERLLEEWQKLKNDGLIKSKTDMLNQITDEYFTSNSKLTVKAVLYYLQFFPLLYNDVHTMRSISFHIPLDGETTTTSLRNDGSGSFTALHLYGTTKTDISNIDSISSELDKAVTKIGKQAEISKLLQIVFNSQLDVKGNYQRAFPHDHNKPEILNAFLKGIDFLFSTSILRKQLPSNTPTWLLRLNDALEKERNALENELFDLIKGQPKTQMRYELTANMLQTSDYYRGKWQELVDAKDVKVKPKTNKEYITVTVEPTINIYLRDLFKLLQYFLSFGLGTSSDKVKIMFNIPIGGQARIIYLSRSSTGFDQIFVSTRGSDWPNNCATPLKFHNPSYDDMVDPLQKVTDQIKLANMMSQASVSDLSNQPSFETGIQSAAPSMTTDEKNEAVRAMVEFMVITMVAEAAAPSDTVKYLFNKILADYIKKRGAFPGKKEMPNLGNLGEKAGRSPTVDDLVLEMLSDMETNNINIGIKFKEDDFPIRVTGGTQKGREYLYDNGAMLIPSYLIKNSAIGITIKARKSCTGS